MPKELSSMLSV